MSFIDSLVSQVEAISPKMDINKAGIVTYYRHQYEKLGRGGWKDHLVKDLAEITGMKPTSLKRRFDPDRLDRVPKTSREKSQYQELAEFLGLEEGRIPPKHGYLVSFDGEIKISNACYPKQFTNLLISGEDAIELANNPDDFMIIFTEYFQGEPLAEDFCGDPTITITAAPAGQGQMHFQHDMNNRGNKVASWFKG